jgi:hypothetical protein
MIDDAKVSRPNAAYLRTEKIFLFFCKKSNFHSDLDTNLKWAGSQNSDLPKPAQTCPNLPKPAQTCPNLPKTLMSTTTMFNYP